MSTKVENQYLNLLRGPYPDLQPWFWVGHLTVDRIWQRFDFNLVLASASPLIMLGTFFSNLLSFSTVFSDFCKHQHMINDSTSINTAYYVCWRAFWLVRHFNCPIRLERLCSLGSSISLCFQGIILNSCWSLKYYRIRLVSKVCPLKQQVKSRTNKTQVEESKISAEQGVFDNKRQPSGDSQEVIIENFYWNVTFLCSANLIPKWNGV